MNENKTHPVQKSNSRQASRIGTKVSLKAYEVYCHVYGQQEALITGDCRVSLNLSIFFDQVFLRNTDILPYIT